MFLQSAVASGTSNPQPGGPVILERSNSCHKESPASEKTQANPSSGRWNYGQEFAENFAESGDFHFWVLLHAVNLRHGLYFPSEGRRAEDFFARKIRRLRPGLNPRTRVPKASTLTSRPPKPRSKKTGH